MAVPLHVQGRLLASPHVARRLGIKTGTLARWRCQGRGPAGWIVASPTLILYPEESVEAFAAEMVQAAPARLEAARERMAKARDARRRPAGAERARP